MPRHAQLYICRKGGYRLGHIRFGPVGSLDALRVVCKVFIPTLSVQNKYLGYGGSQALKEPNIPVINTWLRYLKGPCLSPAIHQTLTKRYRPELCQELVHAWKRHSRLDRTVRSVPAYPPLLQK